MVYSNTPDSPRPLQKLRAQLSAATGRAEAQQSGHALRGALFLLAAYCRAGQAAILEVNGSTKTLLNASLAATGQAKEKQRIAGLLANPEVRAALQEKGSYVSNKHPLGNKPGVSATAKSGKTASLAVLKLQSTGTGYYCLLLFSEFPRLWTKKTLLALKHPAARLAEVAGAINRNSALQAKQGVMPAPGFCYFADGHGRFAGITESVSLSLGYEKAEFLNNRSLFESLLPRYYLPVWQGRLSIVSPNACDAAQLEVIVATKSGKPVRIGFFTVPVYKSGSSPAGYCSVAHVMSDGEHLEKSTKLAALPAEAAGLLADPPALEIWVNHDKTVSYISDSFEALTGYPAEKFIENPALFRDITHPDDLAPWDDYALSIAQDRKPKEIERRIICMNGEVRRLKTRITHVTDPAGNYRGFLSSTTVAERQLPPANKAAKEMPSISEVEQFYKAITDFTFDLEIYLLTGNKIVYVSPSSLRITGYSPEEAVSNPELLTALLHPADRAQAEQFREKVKSSRQPQITELRIRRRDGKLIWLEVAGVKVYNETGLLLGYRLSCRDITRRKELESELSLRSRQYAGIVESQLDLIVRYRTEGTILFANKPFAAFYGTTPEKLEGSSIHSLIPTERKDDFLGMLSKLSERKPVIKRVYSYPQANGNVTFIEWSDKCSFDSEGNPVEVQAVGRDVTGLIRIQEQLQQSEARYRAVLESQTDMIVRFSADSTLQYINAAFARWMGVDAGMLIGRQWLGMLENPAIWQMVAKQMESMTTDDPSRELELSRLRGDDDDRWYSWIGTGIFDSAGQLIELQVVGRDITRQKKAEAALLSAYEKIKELEQLYRITADFTPDMDRWVLPGGKLAYISPACEKLTGYTRREFMDNPALLDHIIHPLDTERYIAARHAYQDGEEITSAEYRIITKAGTEKWIEITANRVYDDEGNAMGTRTSSRDISLRKQLEENLRISRDQYSKFVEAQLDLICRYLPDGTLQFVNQAYAQFFGSQPEFLAGTSIFSLVPAHRLSDFHNIISQLSAGAPFSRDEQNYTDAGGNTVWIEWINFGSFDTYGVLQEIQGVGRDITHLKETEQQLRTASGLYTGLVEEQVDFVCRLTLNADINFVNGSLARFYGVAPAKMIGTNWSQWASADNYSALLRKLQHSAPYDSTLKLTMQATSAAGQKHWIEWVAKGIFGDDGILTEIQAIGRDITDLIQAAEQLTVSENCYKAVVENQSDIIIRYSSDHKVLYANEAIRKFIGIGPAEITGLSWNEIVSKNLVPYDSLIAEAGVLATDFGETELLHTMPDGSRRWISWVQTAIAGRDGKPREMQIVGRDITRLKETELQLVTALQEVEGLKLKLEEENRFLRTSFEPAVITGSMFSEAPVMAEVLEKARQVAYTDTPVLLTGETGTGKEVLAHDIHMNSKRSHKVMITVNCAALPPSLIESELFGREKGAYTGAMAKQIGLFELADGSTIFLDEIGELPLEMQVKLLRIIQSGEFQMLGSPVTKKTDVRIIAATNRDLSKAIAEGRFRSDLFYRLNVFPINLPPLRERKEDIAVLAWNFVDELSQTMGKQIDRISPKGMKKLMDYDWPGNIRELRNILEYSIILCNSPKLDIQLHATGPEELKFDNLDLELKRHIEKVLIQTGWKVRGEGGAAERLGMKESTLRFRMKKLGISKKS